MDEVPRTTPDSWRVLREAMGDKRKWVAHAVRRATSLVDRWLVPPPSPGNPDSSGDINPLDFLISIITACDAERRHGLLDWLCRRFGARCVPQDGGQGDGRLFRDLTDAVPHLQAAAKEIKKAEKCSVKVLRVHLDEAWIIVTSNLAETSRRGAMAGKQEDTE